MDLKIVKLCDISDNNKVESYGGRLFSCDFFTGYCNTVIGVETYHNSLNGLLQLPKLGSKASSFRKMCAILWYFFRTRQLRKILPAISSVHKMSRATLPFGNIKT